MIEKTNADDGALKSTPEGPTQPAAKLRERKTRSKVHEDVLKLPKEIRNIFAGGMAGMVAKSVVAPFDRIKILYQISSAHFRISNVPVVALKIIKNEGWTALWKGNTATMIRVFPYSGIQFMVYDRCKTFLLREQEIDYVRRRAADPGTPKPRWGLSPTESLGSGMIAGALSVAATYPLDLTRAQLAVLRRKKGAANLSFYQVITGNYTNRVCTIISILACRFSNPTYSSHHDHHLYLYSYRGSLVFFEELHLLFWGFCLILELRSPLMSKGNEK
jgi:hypothetical protein